MKGGVLGSLKDLELLEKVIHVVAVTAFVNEENVKQCYRVGMSDVIHKPVSTESLKRIIDLYYFL